MTYEKKLILISLGAILLLSIAAGSFLKSGKEEYVPETMEIQESSELPPEPGPGYEMQETEAFIFPSGEDGDADYREPGKEIPVSVSEGRGTKRKLIELAFDSNGCIVYADTNTFEEYRSGFIKGTSDDNCNPMLDFSEKEERREGINPEGYVVWLYRNTFGSLPDSFDSLSGMYKSGKKIRKEDLTVGDIGMSDLSASPDTRYGVCIGLIEGVPVFTHLSPIPDVGRKNGTNYISYLKELKDAPLDGSAPVSLKYFVRPDISWEED